MRTQAPHDSTDLALSPGRSAAAVALLAGLCLVWALGGCATEKEVPAKKPATKADAAGLDAESGDSSDGVSGDSAEPADALPDVVATDESADAQSDEDADVLADSDPDSDDAAPADADDVQPVDAAQCATAVDCAGVINLLPCQDAICDSGACKPVPKPYPWCCSSAACNDKDQCTQDSCDPATSQCVNKVDNNCCSGKLTLLKSGFEGKALEELKATEGPSNGNVSWHLSTARAHSGMQSLYFGNACKTYDTSMSVEGGCVAGKDAQAVSTALTSADYVLPAAAKAHLVFWVFLDVEPPYTADFKPGVCKPGCPQGSSCVIYNGEAQCMAEKDVLSVAVIDAGKILPLFWSTQIGKTTAGKWQRVAIDVSAWAGKTIKLQWQFQSGTNLKNGYEGVYLDDVLVETVCAQLACDAATPCKDDGSACTDDICTAYVNGTGGAGACMFDKQSGCCTAASDCDDGQACTVDACVGGKCQSKPDASKPACCKPSVSLYDGFDTGALEGWTTSGQNSSLVGWRVLPTGGVTGGTLAFSDQAGSTYADAALPDDAGPKGLVCSAPIALKQGTLHDLLTFQLKMDTEWTGLAAKNYKNPPIDGLPKFDVFSVLVQEQGQTKPVWSSDLVYGTTDGQWKSITVPLDAWQGKTVQVCLSFDAGDANKNDFMGVRIDELALKVACSKQACYLDSECAALSCTACQTNSCDAAAGCMCKAVAGCCLADADCDDADKCTTDSCKAAACVHDPIADCTP